MGDPAVRYTYEEWLTDGEARFGTDHRQWRFVCPVCGGAQSMADFDALPESSRPKDARNVVNFSCIGRWTNAPEAFAMGKGKRKAPKPTPETHCNYTLGGLFTLPRAIVTTPDGKEVPSFAFAPAPTHEPAHVR
jgi:hypothetical protein